MALAELDHRGMVRHIEHHAFGFPRDAGIAGAHQSFVTSGEAAIFHASACSRPPEPSRRICMGKPMEVDETESVARTPAPCKGIKSIASFRTERPARRSGISKLMALTQH